MNDLIQKIYKLKEEKETQEALLNDTKSKISELDVEISSLQEELLSRMKSENINEVKDGDLVAVRFARENIGYKDEAEVLKYLKENYDGQYIKTKISESIDKNPLKKALKTDSTLASALESMTVRSLTEYTVVTDAASYQKMLEHIDG